MSKAKLSEQLSRVSHYHIGRILYATDLNTNVDEALEYAVTLALTYDAKLLVCHCTSETITDVNAEADRRSFIEHHFTESIGRCVNPGEQPTLQWESIITSGEVAEAIADQARLHKVDLIVMRSRRRPYTASLLGSTAEKVCRLAPCAVLVTHADEHNLTDNSAGDMNINRILVACDFSDYSKLAVSYALSLAKAYESELHLLHVLPANLEHAWAPIFGNPEFEATNRLHDILMDEVRLSCKVIKEVVTKGEPYNQILKYAQEHNCDLICIGAHGEGYNSGSIFGTNADQIVRKSSCPVLVARTLIE
ncbi:MAG: universal stress protein [Acidobacteriota bacterium]